MKRRVAITGLGAVTPIGNSAPETWNSLINGRSGVGHITTFPLQNQPVHIAGLVKDFDLTTYVPEYRMRRYLSRGAGYGVAAFMQAMADAQIPPGLYQPAEKGVVIGCGVQYPELERMLAMLYQIETTGGKQLPQCAPSDVLIRSHNVGMATMALLGECQGPLIGISTACASSAHAIGEAFRCIQDGDARVMVTGGYDAMTSFIDVLGFTLVGALTSAYNDDPQKASRPFDRDRSGFVLGEGGVVIILEEWESAVSRGAPIYAELVGFASSLNAYRMTDAPPNGDGPIQAMARALKDADLKSEDIDYIVAHGTSTPSNDSCETTAIKAVFGSDAYRLAISSPKSMTGHLTAGSGALNMLAAVYALRDQIIPPTINQDNPDPRLDLNYVPNVAQKRPVRAAMVNAFAFGGTNAALVARQVTN
ncbi:beta-ketoacyl-[acyl-carrier-protein] synthase family protein [Tengunoibacter tsumagoiensis]|uniref:3-oxoacyl-[acyl-carrier-protein] synthase 2 n=1 Tax=Tengunoibacter tsumagoiensis TaxID=2014871 RepID=A0A402A746_9CHLR|nr:beta-ketoacyl-[acyl-carrier-protein] synthase family protein [Tengunoibacter tsumagoiensis]GCE14919.1 3-oxoacyl-[acyl-carrier-protein] synthase 2 [Tengunoibacter tsumagoiensis]